MFPFHLSTITRVKQFVLIHFYNKRNDFLNIYLIAMSSDKTKIARYITFWLSGSNAAENATLFHPLQ